MSTQDFVIERRRAGYAIRHYEGNEPIITLPSHFDNNPIEIVGDYAFSRNVVINQVTIPAGVEYRVLCFRNV